MIKVKREGKVLAPTSLDFENKSVFNPGVFQDGNTVHIIYRALNEKFNSCLGYARLKGPTKVVERWKKPFMSPRYVYEKKGVEDPRLTKIGNKIYMTYVAHDGKNAVIAYASGRKLAELKRGGIISPLIRYKKAGRLFSGSRLKDPYYFFASFYEIYAGKNVYIWEKDGVFFPEKIRGKFAMLHRILPDIQLARFEKFTELKNKDYWRDHIKKLSKHVVLEARYGFESRHIGAGAPPVKTDKGWLIIYHACQSFNNGRIYTAAAALLDLRDPRRVIARLPYPLFRPRIKNERCGHVHNVVFPTGTAIFDNRLYIYYGSADSFVSVASVNIDSLLKELLKYKNKHK